jgi:hypothetical protein
MARWCYVQGRPVCYVGTMSKAKVSAQLKVMISQLEQFSEEGLGVVLSDELNAHADKAREHLHHLADELAEVGL